MTWPDEIVKFVNGEWHMQNMKVESSSKIVVCDVISIITTHTHTQKEHWECLGNLV